MNKKDLHIVYGFTGKSVLSQSQFVNPEHSDILAFSDPLSEGPLCDLGDQGGIERRKKWVDKVFGSDEPNTGLHLVEETLAELQTLLDTIKNYNGIYLWLGRIANEQITTARLLYHLQELPIPVYQVDFSKAAIVNADGKTVTFDSLNVISIENIKKIEWCFEEMSKSAKQASASLWKRLLVDVAVFRHFNKEGECIMGDDTFYDR